MHAKLRTLAGGLATAAMLTLPACYDMTPKEGLVYGAMAGLITAQVLEQDNDWTIVAILAGAAIGSIVARNDRTHQCAYAHDRGTYRVASCPPGYFKPHR